MSASSPERLTFVSYAYTKGRTQSGHGNATIRRPITRHEDVQVAEALIEEINGLDKVVILSWQEFLA